MPVTCVFIVFDLEAQRSSGFPGLTIHTVVIDGFSSTWHTNQQEQVLGPPRQRVSSNFKNHRRWDYLQAVESLISLTSEKLSRLVGLHALSSG